ncbi:MAG: hypothetical protein IPK60_19560 [Sandaracinaceae bacterium]|nr:hypothetical protein [Sandaracinaceae bacterium]
MSVDQTSASARALVMPGTNARRADGIQATVTELSFNRDPSTLLRRR